MHLKKQQRKHPSDFERRGYLGPKKPRKLRRPDAWVKAVWE